MDAIVGQYRWPGGADLPRLVRRPSRRRLALAHRQETRLVEQPDWPRQSRRHPPLLRRLRQRPRRLRRLDRADTLGNIDAGNAKRASEDLQLAASALEAIGADIIRARELALWAASDTLGDAERTTIGSELELLRERLMANANALDSSGNALFGGESSGRAYEVGVGGVIGYIGTGASGEIELGQGQTLIDGERAAEAFSHREGRDRAVAAGGPLGVFHGVPVTVKENILNPRVHPCPMETCGCVASQSRITSFCARMIENSDLPSGLALRCSRRNASSPR